MFNFVAAIEGLISSVPEAILAWQKLAPFLPGHVEIPPAQVAEINAMVPAAHAAVEMAHQAIAAIVSTHTPNAPAA